MLYPNQPPPFIGTWSQVGGGKKNLKTGKRNSNITGKNSSKHKSKSNLVEGTSSRSNNLRLKNKPLSYFDLQNWRNYLNIRIKGIFSRNEHMPKQHSPCIITLDEVEI